MIKSKVFDVFFEKLKTGVLFFILFVFVLFFISNYSYSKNIFTDVPTDSWFYNYVTYIFEDGITTGFPDDTYRPYELVTRAQMAAFLSRALKINIPDKCSTAPFKDVPVNSWYCPYVEALKNADIVQGVGSDLYNPTGFVTRAETAAFLTKALGLEIQPCSSPPFPDVPRNAWYCEYIQALKNTGIVNGYPDGTYKPETQVNRAIMAAFLAKAFIIKGGKYFTKIQSEQQTKDVSANLINSFDIVTKNTGIASLLSEAALMTFNGQLRSSDLSTANNTYFNFNALDPLLDKMSKILPIMFYALRNTKFYFGLLSRNPLDVRFNCDESGYYDINGTYDDDNNYYNVSIIYENCSTNNITIDGNMEVKGTVDPNNYNFSVLIDNISINDKNNNMFLKFKNFSENAKGMTFYDNGSTSSSYNLNGGLNINSANDNLKINFTNFLINNNFNNGQALSKFNGLIKNNWKYNNNNRNLNIFANNFIFKYEIGPDNEPNLYVNGVLSITHSPQNFCPMGSGVFKIATEQPLANDQSTGKLSKGEILINNDIEIQWTSGNIINISLDGNQIYSGDEKSYFENDECLMPTVQLP